MASSAVSSLLEQIQSGVKYVTDESARLALLQAARSVVTILEHPAERLARLSWAEPLGLLAARVGIELDLFNKMLEDDNSPKSIEKLSGMTNTDPKFLIRIMRHMAALDLVRETGIAEYQANNVSKELATPEAAGMVVCSFDMGPPKLNSIQYFKEHKFQNPADKDDNGFQYGYETKKHLFEWLASPGNEYLQDAFNNYMRYKTISRKWYEILPCDQLLESGPTDPSGVLLVDVGGNSGIDLYNFHKAWPHLTGRLIVQDLPSVIDLVKPEDIKPVEPMPHNFFDPQPIKAAKAYYMKMVLHDWPDKSCREILSNLKPAMKAGYSKILINEIVIPDTGANWFATGVDMLMMTFHSSEERGETRWHELVESVGLRVAKIWDCAEAQEKIIEVELP